MARARTCSCTSQNGPQLPILPTQAGSRPPRGRILRPPVARPAGDSLRQPDMQLHCRLLLASCASHRLAHRRCAIHMEAAPGRDLSFRVREALLDAEEQPYTVWSEPGSDRPLRANLDLLVFRGRTLARRGDKDGARATYLRCVALDPLDGRGWLALGRLSERDGDPDAAIAMIERGLAHNAGNAYLLQAAERPLPPPLPHASTRPPRVSGGRCLTLTLTLPSCRRRPVRSRRGGAARMRRSISTRAPCAATLATPPPGSRPACCCSAAARRALPAAASTWRSPARLAHTTCGR